MSKRRDQSAEWDVDPAVVHGGRWSPFSVARLFWFQDVNHGTLSSEEFEIAWAQMEAIDGTHARAGHADRNVRPLAPQASVPGLPTDRPAHALPGVRLDGARRVQLRHGGMKMSAGSINYCEVHPDTECFDGGQKGMWTCPSCASQNPALIAHLVALAPKTRDQLAQDVVAELNNGVTMETPTCLEFVTNGFYSAVIVDGTCLWDDQDEGPDCEGCDLPEEHTCPGDTYDGIKQHIISNLLEYIDELTALTKG